MQKRNILLEFSLVVNSSGYIKKHPYFELKFIPKPYS